jgi:hypothetical protein
MKRREFLAALGVIAAVRESLVGTKRTCRLHCAMSAPRGNAEKHMLDLSSSGFDPGCVKTQKIERRRE